MAKYKIAAVSRAGAYSPNHIGNDAAILHATAEHLRKRGCEVKMYSEEEFQKEEISADLILNMCREKTSIEKLQRLEDAGMFIINSGYGIENCTRELMTRLLIREGVPYPESLIVDTNADSRDALRKAGIERCWVKRGESHAIHKEDVSFSRHIEETQELLHEFFYRGIKRAVINRHIDGDLVKFYGLSDGSFFYHFLPLSAHHSKFGVEEINGKEHNYAFDSDLLKEISIRAAKVTGIDIFGGDCIISPDGEITIIDFNDWPSFAPCREEAAPAIAKSVLAALKARMKSENQTKSRKNGKQEA